MLEKPALPPLATMLAALPAAHKPWVAQGQLLLSTVAAPTAVGSAVDSSGTYVTGACATDSTQSATAGTTVSSCGTVSGSGETSMLHSARSATGSASMPGVAQSASIVRAVRGMSIAIMTLQSVVRRHCVRWR